VTDVSAFVGGQVVQDDVDRGAVGAGSPDRLQCGQGVGGTFLAAVTAAAGPAALLLGLDEALADTPAPTGAGPLDTRLATARELYDKGTHRRLLAALPGLIANGHAAARSRRELDQAWL